MVIMGTGSFEAYLYLRLSTLSQFIIQGVIHLVRTHQYPQIWTPSPIVSTCTLATNPPQLHMYSYLSDPVADPGENLTGDLHSNLGLVSMVGVVSMKVRFMR